MRCLEIDRRRAALVVGLQEDNDVGPLNSYMKVDDPFKFTTIDLEPIDVGVNV